MKRIVLIPLFFILMLSGLLAVQSHRTTNVMKPYVEEIQTYPSMARSDHPTLRTEFINLDFTGTFPPTGWSIDTAAAHWGTNASANAGGTSPELRFNWSPQYNGSTYLISPMLDTTGNTALVCEFKHMVDHYGTGYTVGVATRSNSGTWHPIWSVTPTDMVGPEPIAVMINNADVGSSQFQIALYFTGNSYQINYWYVDDFKLYSAFPHEMQVSSIDVASQVDAGSPVTPAALLTNMGTSTEMITATCEVFQDQTSVYTNTQNATVNSAQQLTVSFAPFTPEAPNQLYHVVVTANVDGDANTANNTLVKYFNTYTTERQDVVVEIGTGTWCQYCPGAALGADDLESNGHDVAIIEHHGGSATEPFMNDASAARIIYYNITGFPTAFFDGGASVVGGNHTTSMYASYLPLYQAAKAIKSAFELSMNGVLDQTNLNVAITVQKMANFAAQPLVVHFAVTESNISYSWQGQTELNFVNRGMFPSAEGTPLDFAGANSAVITINATLNASWVTNNMQLVAFVQNPETKEVMQGLMIPLPDLQGTVVVNPPTNLTSQINMGQVTLNWQNPTTPYGLTGFKVYRGTEVVFTTTHPTNHSYTDTPGLGDFTYHVTALFGEVESDPSNEISVHVTSASDPVVPVMQTALKGNYPNPFTPVTSIHYQIAKSTPTQLEIYNVKGQLVKTLVNKVQGTGSYEVNWNGADENGSTCPTGIYFYRLHTNEGVLTGKAMLIK